MQFHSHFTHSPSELKHKQNKNNFFSNSSKTNFAQYVNFPKIPSFKKKRNSTIKAIRTQYQGFFSHKRFVNTPIWRFGSSMSKIDVFSEVCKNHFCCTKTKMKFRTAIKGRKIWKQKPRRQCVKSVYELVAVRFL